MPKRSRTTFQAARRIALGFPGVEEGISYGTDAFRVKGRFLPRLREDGETLVVKCGFDERDYRMMADPPTFFTTDHYRRYATELVRLLTVSPRDLHDVLEQAWRMHAPKRLLAQYEPVAERGARAPNSSPSGGGTPARGRRRGPESQRS